MPVENRSKIPTTPELEAFCSDYQIIIAGEPNSIDILSCTREELAYEAANGELRLQEMRRMIGDMLNLSENIYSDGPIEKSKPIVWNESFNPEDISIAGVEIRNRSRDNLLWLVRNQLNRTVTIEEINVGLGVEMENYFLGREPNRQDEEDTSPTP